MCQYHQVDVSVDSIFLTRIRSGMGSESGSAVETELRRHEQDYEEAGHKVEKINVISKKSAGCLGCGRTGIVGLLTIHGHRS